MPTDEQLLRMKAEREARAMTPREIVAALSGEPIEYVPTYYTASGEADDARDEKAIVLAADKQLRALGFVVVNYSQPRASKQTPGIPDREYFHPGRGVLMKWEAKTSRGVQSPAQRQYQEWCDACGIAYVVGPETALYAWLIAQGIAAREMVGELLIALPYTPQSRSA